MRTSTRWLSDPSRRTQDGGAGQWRDHEHRFHMGQAGNQSDTVIRVFDGQSGIAFFNSAPRDGARRTRYPRQCTVFSRRRRQDADL